MARAELFEPGADRLERFCILLIRPESVVTRFGRRLMGTRARQFWVLWPKPKRVRISQISAEMSAAAVTGSTWWDYFIGNIHGSMGETCTLACLIGAAILIFSRIGSWRIMAGVDDRNDGVFRVFVDAAGRRTGLEIPPWWHLVIGGFAFGTVFMATDPVSASMTRQGKWIYGALIGFMTVLVRSVNPAFPEGIMLAILFGNVFAPLIDYCVVQANVKRRVARYAT